MAALPRPQPSHCGLKVRDWQAIPPVHWHSPRTHYAIADCRLPGATRQPSYRHAAPPPPLASSGPQPQQASWLHICREVGHQGFPALRLTSNGPKQHPCMWWVLATAGPRAAAAVKLAPARLAAPPAPPPPPPAAADTAVGAGAFEELCAGTERKYIMVSGKGGVGKTSLAASLAVRFAQEGHTTLVVSTDPAHSLGDSLAQVGHCREGAGAAAAAGAG